MEEGEEEGDLLAPSWRIQTMSLLLGEVVVVALVGDEVVERMSVLAMLLLGCFLERRV
jgi:hypothetical protein